jgi:putative ABC transport system permease protein
MTLLSLRFALRELRGGLSGFRVFLAILALGVGIIAAVGSLSASLTVGIEANARALLGGDVEIRLDARPATAEERAYFAATSEAASAVRELRAMVRNGNGAALVELKGVDGAYPLYGEVRIESGEPLQQALEVRDGVAGAVAEPELLSRLGIHVGEPIALGNATFELRGVLAEEPDRTASAFSIGPRVMVSDGALADTGLVVLGSLVDHHYRVRLTEGVDAGAWAEDLGAAFPEAAWRVRPYDRGQPAVQRFVDRFAAFLALVGLTVLVIGGVGIANAVQSYLSTRTETIATFKCLGADGGFVFAVYAWQIGLLAVIGIALGLVAGTVAPLLAPPLIGDSLPVALTFGIYPGALALSAAYGLLTAIVFALWPLARAREVPAAGLFRALVSPPTEWPRPAYLALFAAAVAALVLLAVFGGGNATFAAWFVGGTAAALIGFRLLAWIVVRVLAALPRPRNTSLRLALSGLVRPGAPTANVVMSLGAGLSVLIAVAQLDGNLARQVQEQIPERAPAFFFIGIPPGDAAAFDEVVGAVPGVEHVERVPTLRGRTAIVNGVPADEVRTASGDHWFLHHEIGLTYTAGMPGGTALTAGEWWPEGYAGLPILSLDARTAEEIGIEVGDTLVFTILGREVSGTVANLRRIEWESMGLNFAVIFAPGALEDAPQTHVASVTVDAAAEDTLFRTATQEFPNVTAIRVREVLERVTGMIAQIGVAVRAVALLTIAAGVLVLAGAIAAGQRARLYDSVVLKVLGATRGDVLRANLLEYAVLGTVTATVALAVGTAAAWATIRFVMEAEFQFAVAGALGAAAGGAILIVLLGLAGTWRMLGLRPAPVLRTA